ncbi:DUF6161 domain-containing protein [Legionella worsleiensis]|uniref:DUF6161 domain-containing protein n=1 Tax=Legionella worsleiensis TaxID=45076 RepID=A0A0W1AB35_9GAMM|nr:DUF6161 domain-containing protein [Legionella worsleiensis]KTD78307.1 hypothetical protein Lwor_1702 [Legionella worsleiensis]STY32644.1 Uncharacterised protein [Legionella worsleiensis]
MDKKEKSAVFLSLKFADREIDFHSPEELQKFNQSENQAWSWLSAAVQKDNNLGPIANVYNNFWNALSEFIGGYNRVKDNEDQIANLKNQLNNKTKTAITQNYILYDSPDGRFVNQCKDTHDVQVAGYCLAFLMKAKITFNSSTSLEGCYWAIQYMHGNTKTVAAIQKSLELTKRDWEAKFSYQYGEAKNNNDEISQQIELLKSQYEELVVKTNGQLEKQEADFKSKIQESEEKLNDIAHTYDNKLALQSSVNYWTGKKDSHKNIMIWVGIGTLALACLTGGGFVWAAYELLQETIAQVPLWKLGFMLAISSFGVWLTRLSAKIFISNLHLWTDSSERVTMIQTYLALLREGSGPKDDERQLILQTLFRPSATGFVYEEGPTGFHEILAQKLIK